MDIAMYEPGYPEKLKTKRQWALEGYLPLPDCLGTMYWTTPYKDKRARYYCDQEVAPATKEQLAEYWAPERERRKEYRRRRAAIAKYTASLHKASLLPAVPCDNPSGTIIFDTETTGKDPGKGHDEILQISIIDADGNTLINSYVKPRLHTEWPEAAAINRITPEKVSDAPDPEELIPVVKGIFESADTLIAYNGRFDLSFLDVWGICPTEEQTVIDVMPLFAEVYGEWSNYYCNYKWQTLSTAAKYFGYKFAAHDSLEDVRATLHIYNRLRGLNP